MQTINQLNVNGSNPSTVGGTGTTQKIFPYVPGPSIGVAATATSPYYGVGAIALPGSARLNGQQFTISASGNFEVGSGGTCPSVTFVLLAATSLANLKAGTYTQLGTSGAITTQNLTGTFYPWLLNFDLQGDTASGVVQGNGYFQVDGTWAPTTVGNGAVGIMGTTTGFNQLSGVSFTNENTVFFAVGVTYSVSESGNSANMYEFKLEA